MFHVIFRFTFYVRIIYDAHINVNSFSCLLSKLPEIMGKVSKIPEQDCLCATGQKAEGTSGYQGEVLRVIRGESRLDADLLGELIEKAKAEIRGSLRPQSKPSGSWTRNWADLYDRCNFAAKKMIVSQFVKAVYVHRNYDIEIEFNVPFEEFRALTVKGCTV